MATWTEGDRRWPLSSIRATRPKVANACPTLAADGAVLFLEKIALEQVDSS